MTEPIWKTVIAQIIQNSAGQRFDPRQYWQSTSASHFSDCSQTISLVNPDQIKVQELDCRNFWRALNPIKLLWKQQNPYQLKMF